MRACFLAAAGLLALSTQAEAKILRFATVLSGANEQIPNAVSATGTASLALDTDAKTVTYRVEYAGLSGKPVMVHFHGLRPASGGAPEVIIKRIDHPPSPVTGTQALTEQQIAQLEHGDWYANIHTLQYPDGEIRGWLVPASDSGAPLARYFGRPPEQKNQVR